MAGYRHEEGERAPKPYTLIDLAPQETIQRRAPEGHDVLKPGKLAGQLRITLEALTPVHVGSGVHALTGEQRRPLAKALLRVGETPVIPGSSLKGCVRSVFEAITPACLRVTRAREVPRTLEGCRQKDKLCIACRLFGAQDFQGLIRFSDMVLQKPEMVEIVEVPQFYRPRTREKTYVSGRFVRGRKFYKHGNRQAQGDGPIEVCAVGSRFAGVIDFANLDAGEVGLLLVALGQDTNHPLVLKLGGAKPACYGSVRVEVTLTCHDHAAMQQRYDTWETPQEQQGTDAAPYLAAAQKLLLQPQLRMLASILTWPGEEECPAGNY